MRDLIAELALRVYISLKGEQEMIAMLFACRVVEGRTSFEAVPPLLKQRVSDVIISDFKMPELVPTEYGGTKE